jgi:acetyl-CoA carboxylase biotin carboxyl carrier protein
LGFSRVHRGRFRGQMIFKIYRLRQEEGMDLETIFSIIDRAEKSSFSKFSIETQEVKISLEKETHAPAYAPAPANEKAAAREHDSDALVFAPISGVFYVAREPGAEPYVREGGRVKKGDVLCLIEAMKTMNEITAPKDGVIESILKKDAEAIVAKDALFKYARAN